MKSIPVIKLSLVRIALKDICRMIEVRFPYGSHRLFQRIESTRPAPKNTPEPITQGCFATISPVPILFAGRVSLTQQHRRFRWFLRQFLL